MLHIHTDICAENKPKALKTKLGWVIFSGCQNTNKYPNINAFPNEFDLRNMVSKFWQIVIRCLRKTKPKSGLNLEN